MLNINWREGYTNNPTILIEDNLDLLPREECEFIQVEGMFYHIQKNGLVRYFAHDGSDRNMGGFGGSIFTILHNGKEKELKGPWSGRASFLNMFLSEEEQTADISVFNGRSYMSVGILISELSKLWDQDAYLLRSLNKEKNCEHGAVTASLAKNCILKPDRTRYDPSYDYEIFAEPVKNA